MGLAMGLKKDNFSLIVFIKFVFMKKNVQSIRGRRAKLKQKQEKRKKCKWEAKEKTISFTAEVKSHCMLLFE